MANDGSTVNFNGGSVELPPVAPPAWEDITGKPTSFPPAEHANEAHNPDYIDIITMLDAGTF